MQIPYVGLAHRRLVRNGEVLDIVHCLCSGWYSNILKVHLHESRAANQPRNPHSDGRFRVGDNAISCLHQYASSGPLPCFAKREPPRCCARGNRCVYSVDRCWPVPRFPGPIWAVPRTVPGFISRDGMLDWYQPGSGSLSFSGGPLQGQADSAQWRPSRQGKGGEAGQFGHLIARDKHVSPGRRPRTRLSWRCHRDKGGG